MGVMRKTACIFTFGLVDFRSDKERIARYAKQTRDAVRQQGSNVAFPPSLTPVSVPSGWYRDADGSIRYWDGTRWTNEVMS